MNGLEAQARMLIGDLLSGATSPGAFKERYLQTWRNCRDAGVFDAMNASTSQAFDRVFSAVDVYCEDPALRDFNDLDEAGLIKEIERILPDMSGN